MPDLLIGFGRYRRLALCALVAMLLGLGLAALSRLTGEIHFDQVRAAFHAISIRQIVLACVFTTLSFLALTIYDLLALRTIGRSLPWRTAALASFTSYSISNMLGLSLVTGGSARYRIYSAAGLGAADVARVVAIASTTFWLGVTAVAGVALLVHDQPIALSGWIIGVGLCRLAGTLVLVAVASFVLLCASGRRELRFGGLSMPLPTTTTVLAQIGVAAIDLAAASTALFVLLPGAHSSLMPIFFLAYALAIVIALLTHVPGGLGIFEAVIVAIVPTNRAALLAALIVYRVIYYLIPFMFGIVALAWHEGRRGKAGKTIAGMRAVATAMAPVTLSTATFVGGAILLLSGSLPAIPSRLSALRGIVPLPFVNASHLAASLAGTALLLIAPGLYRRLDGAAWLARILLMAGAVFSLAKGLDYEEATVCLIVAGLIHWTRHAFYRRTELVTRPLSPSWMVSVATVVGLTVWIGFFAYKRIDYSDALWWQFAWHGNASRFLRATFGIGVMLSSAAMIRMFLPAPAYPEASPTDDDIRAFTALAARTEAGLAWIGDKRLLFSPERDAAVMYQIEGSSWIVMADPVGERTAWPDLLWQLRTMADASQGRLLLYQISTDMLEIAVEMGLQIVKYGEEALIDLRTFSLAGSAMRSLRQAERRAARDGATFEIIPAHAIETVLDDLRDVSTYWLGAKHQQEKGFSLGRFEDAYVRQFDCAIVRVDGRIVAFANIWMTPGKLELSVDMMRHDDAAPSGTMDFLLCNLMLWGRKQGYARFTLGLAPLSGIESRRLSPNWAKLAGLLFRHGERLYGFRGLRAYKEKYAPLWEPRYIAGPRGIGLLQGLRDLQRLIGRPGDTRKARPATVNADSLVESSNFKPPYRFQPRMPPTVTSKTGKLFVPSAIMSGWMRLSNDRAAKPNRSMTRSLPCEG